MVEHLQYMTPLTWNLQESLKVILMMKRILFNFIKGLEYSQ